MKLRTALLISLFGISGLASAEELKENINVNVNVDNGEGKVVIIKDINGETQTIEETFEAGPDTDVEAMVESILAEHGVDNKDGKKIHKEVIKMVNNGDKDFVWVQKNDDVNVDLIDGKATVIIKKDDNGEVQVIKEAFDIDADTDINVLIDDLMAEHGIEAGDAEVHRKVIKLDKKMIQIDDEKPRMGFMANVTDDGWKIMSVVPDSGAAEAGMQKGDVVISIDGQSTAKGGLALTEFIAMDHQEGEVSPVVVLRDGKEVSLNVTAKVLDSPDVIMELTDGHKWFSSSDKDFVFKSGEMDMVFDGLHVDVEHLDKMVEGLGDHDIRVVTTGDADAYFFSGSKMNQWLGKNHHFSTVTENLGKYFGTTQGVLVLEVDNDNKLGLKDGDVIQAINGKDVKTPKDVIKIMSGFKSDESFEIEIIREKETLYLES
jgi:S1-C subfamily serine protease